MIEPKQIDVKLPEGGTKQYTISKIPAIPAREIIAKYPLSGLPKVGDYAVNEETMLKMLAYVSVDISGSKLALTTKELINNHVPDWETLARIEVAMLEYNCSFFRNGKVSTFLNSITKGLNKSIIEMLTASLQRLLEAEKRPSKN